MSKASREIECLKRLDELMATYDELLEFLCAEDMLSRLEAKAIRSSSEVPKVIHTKLAALSKSNRLQLLEYFWQVLPTELIKITIITDRAHKEFEWNH